MRFGTKTSHNKQHWKKLLATSFCDTSQLGIIQGSSLENWSHQFWRFTIKFWWPIFNLDVFMTGKKSTTTILLSDHSISSTIILNDKLCQPAISCGDCIYTFHSQPSYCTTIQSTGVMNDKLCQPAISCGRSTVNPPTTRPFNPLGFWMIDRPLFHIHV